LVIPLTFNDFSFWGRIGIHIFIQPIGDEPTKSFKAKTSYWVPCCDVRYDFRIKTIFGSFLTPVVYGEACILFTLLVFVFVYI
jgi:hypothetical protein